MECVWGGEKGRSIARDDLGGVRVKGGTVKDITLP